MGREHKISCIRWPLHSVRTHQQRALRRDKLKRLRLGLDSHRLVHIHGVSLWSNMSILCNRVGCPCRRSGVCINGHSRRERHTDVGQAPVGSCKATICHWDSVRGRAIGRSVSTRNGRHGSLIFRWCNRSTECGRRIFWRRPSDADHQRPEPS